jgi:hypothetical protein
VIKINLENWENGKAGAIAKAKSSKSKAKSTKSTKTTKTKKKAVDTTSDLLKSLSSGLASTAKSSVTSGSSA